MPMEDSNSVIRFDSIVGPVNIQNPWGCSQRRDIQMTLMITSKPFDPDFSYLKFHMPSLSLFQNAPEAECIPILPTAISSSSDLKACRSTAC